MTRHCWKCSWEYPRSSQPARTESCHGCGADLRVCLNCTHYDPKVAEQCRERRSDPILEKAVANYCEYFELGRREFKPIKVDPREAEARERMKKLFGD